jgi:hypothetical protein
MNTQPTEKESPLKQVSDLFSKTSKEKRNIELLTLLGELVEESNTAEVTYRGNEKNSELMDFFLNGKYIESCNLQPKVFLDFRAAKIQQGFRIGASHIIEKIFENIQNSGNESK